MSCLHAANNVIEPSCVCVRVVNRENSKVGMILSFAHVHAVVATFSFWMNLHDENIHLENRSPHWLLEDSDFICRFCCPSLLPSFVSFFIPGAG